LHAYLFLCGGAAVYLLFIYYAKVAQHTTIKYQNKITKAHKTSQLNFTQRDDDIDSIQLSRQYFSIYNKRM